MARHLFGGSAADVAEDITGARVPNATGTVWDGPGGSSSRITDLLNASGGPLQEVKSNDQGVLEQFYGPDDVALLWVDFGAGKVSLTPPDVGNQLVQHQAATDPHGDRAYVNEQKGAPLGLATLDGSGVLSEDQLPPSAVDSSVKNFDVTADTTIPLPSLYAVNGRTYRVYVRAMGAQRAITFSTDYRLSTEVTSRTIPVPLNQVLCAEAQYSSLSESWILTRYTVTSGTGGQTPPGSGGDGGTGAVPTVNAGADAAIDAEEVLSRTATDVDNGSAIYSRTWSILSGPLGEGTTISTAKDLSWTPGDSPAGTVDIRQPVCQEMAWEINSTAENGTLDWTTAYRYIEDIDDDRGYTAGLVGFTSATGDMLLLVQEYMEAKPADNALAPFLSGLQACAAVGFGDEASAAAATNLGTPFITAWRNAADNDPVFRRVQRAFRKRVYWDDALAQALNDGLSPLGLALYVDVLVNHGIGNDSQSFGGLLAAARAANPTPKQGGSEATYLLKLCDLRDAVLQDWGDWQEDGRSSMFRSLINTGKFSLLGSVTFSVYGDTYTMNRPLPPVDARIGSYTLRYSATNAVGKASDDLVVTVTGDDGGPGGPGGSEKKLETLTDNFDDNIIDNTKWSQTYPDSGVLAPSETGGRARVPCGAADYAAYLSKNEWTLKDSYAFVRIYPPAKGTATDAYASMALNSATAPEGTTLSISCNTGTGKIRFSHNVDYWDNAAVSLDYNATTHAWVRIREASGTLYWETSPDGLTWTSRRSIATPAWVSSATDMAVDMSSHRDAGTTDYSEFDNFNVTPA